MENDLELFRSLDKAEEARKPNQSIAVILGKDVQSGEDVLCFVPLDATEFAVEWPILLMMPPPKGVPLTGVVMHAAADLTEYDRPEAVVHHWNNPDFSYLGTTDKVRPPTFPADTLGSMWNEWCEAHAESRNVPLDFVAAPLLAGVGGLIGNRLRANPKYGWNEVTAVWVCSIGNVSSGKSPGQDPIGNLLTKLEVAEAVANQPKVDDYNTKLQISRIALKAWAKDVAEAIENDIPLPDKPAAANEPERPISTRIITSNATVEAVSQILKYQPNGMLLHRDELSGWLNEMNKFSNGGDREFWLEAFGGRRYTIDRVKFNGAPQAIPLLTMSVLGTIQPEKLEALIDKSPDDGLVERFLWCWPEYNGNFSLESVPIDETGPLETLRRIFKIEMDMARDFSLQPQPVHLSPEAREIFQAFGRFNKGRVPMHSGKYAGALGKATGYA